MVGSHNFELTFLVLKNQVHFEPQQKKKRWKVKTLLEGGFFFFFFFTPPPEGFNFSLPPEIPKESNRLLPKPSRRGDSGGLQTRSSYKDISISRTYNFSLFSWSRNMKDWSTSFHIFLAKKKKRGGSFRPSL
jgi:hypothetical protein